MLLRLAQEGSNIAVVGDEDQALYRFRGATVRNILEFPKRFENCHTVTLSMNYRSHRDIINGYDKFMQAGQWDDRGSGEGSDLRKRLCQTPNPPIRTTPPFFLSGEKKKRTKQADSRIL
ncbi:ATP-dependent DNA helicase Rep [subsurface metagenome]